MPAKIEISNIARRRQLAQGSNEKDYLEKRSELLRAAAGIFRDKGYEGASISDFARAIGINRASVYYYISGKAELFQEIVQSAVELNVARVEAIRDGDDTPEAKIRDIVVSLMKSYEDHFPYLYVYVQEDMLRIAATNTSWARAMRRLSERFDAATLAIVEQGIENGSIRASGASAQMIAFAIIGMCNWSHRWFRPSGKASGESIGQQFANIILDGLKIA